jgi:acyl-CoA synthetase (AMP-forming)/AMP-acid ligase II
MQPKDNDCEVTAGSTRLTSVFQVSLKNSPDKTALIVGDHACSYRKLDEMIDLYGRALNGIGAGKDSIVGIFMPNCLDIVWLFLACNRIGAIANMTSAFAQTEEVIYEANSCRIEVLLVHSSLYPVVEGIGSRVPSLKKIFIVDAPDDHPLAWSRAVRSAPALITKPVLSEEQVAVIFYTSGSTGRPKGVTHTHGAFFTAAYNLAVTRRNGPDDRFAMSFHLCHAATYRILLSMFYCGGMCVFYDNEKMFGNFDAAAFIESLGKYGINYITASPSIWRQILDYPQLQKKDFAALKYLSATGDATTSELQREVKEKLGLPLAPVLGMTECGSFIMTGENVDPLPGELGYPIHATSVRLVDENDRDVRRGEAGQIIMKSDAVTVGYWKDPVNTAAVLKDGWFYTGDMARQDEEGRYYFVGRIKNTIIRNSGNITPEEVEDAVSRHPSVKSCGVTGVPDEKHGQAVAAVIVPADPETLPDPEELRRFLTPMISARKIPEFWYFTDKLPLNTVNKLDRKQLAGLVPRLAAEQGR